MFAVAGAAAIWWCTPAGPALAQGTAGPPEVTVDLGVLDSLGSAPAHHREIEPRPPRERTRAAKPEHKPAHTAATTKPPAKKAAAKPAHPAKHEATAESQHPVTQADARRDEADRAARDEEVWEADRKREETDRKRQEADRIKREEAARMKQAKAEIEETARGAERPAKTSENILDPGAGPATPPEPTPPPPKQAAEPPANAPAQVATTTTTAAPPPPTSVAPPRAPASVQPKPAAVEAPASTAPHVDFAVGAADLSAAARAELDTLAKQLNADQDERVQLVAYATGTSDEANQARRLSLSRALNVRAYLIDHGVRNTRMDVRALGNRPDGNKPADRVEILLLK